jgi:hypothetical protein
MLAALLAINPPTNDPQPPRLVSYPIVATAALSPLAVVMNTGLHYWDFIFTLIYNYAQGLGVELAGEDAVQHPGPVDGPVVSRQQEDCQD